MAPVLLFLFVALIASTHAVQDWRALTAGTTILADAYLDQPNVVFVPHPNIPNRTRWIATITRNSAPEGHRGEHVEVGRPRLSQMLVQQGVLQG